MTDTAAVLQKSLIEAGQALSNGETAEAERRAKAISTLVRAERDVVEFAAMKSATDNDDDKLCDELLGRLIQYAEADRQGAPLEVLERIATEGAVQ